MSVFILLAVVPRRGSGQPPRPAGENPQITLSPLKLAFGSQMVGVTSQPQTVTLSNSSASGLTIDDILTSGIDFAQTSSCGASLASGRNCTIAVTFRPAISGPRSGTLILFDSAPHSPQLVSLTGSGK